MTSKQRAIYLKITSIHSGSRHLYQSQWKRLPSAKNTKY